MSQVLTTVPNPRYIANNLEGNTISRAERAQVLNNIRALLNGGKVPQGKYKDIVGDSTAPKGGMTEVTKSIEQRIKDLKEDKRKLYGNKQCGTDDTYESHINAVKQQINALRETLEKLKDGVPEASRTAFEKNLIETVANKLKEFKVPEKPDSYYRPITKAEKNANRTPAGKPTLNTPDRCTEEPVTNPATSQVPKKSDSNNENKDLKTIVNSIPVLNQDQKDAIGKTLNGIQKIVDKGQDYWNKHGQQQVIDTLTTVAKIPVVVAVFIVAAIANALGFDFKPQLSEAGSRSDKTAATSGNGTTLAMNPTNPTVSSGFADRVVAANFNSSNTIQPFTRPISANTVPPFTGSIPTQNDSILNPNANFVAVGKIEPTSNTQQNNNSQALELTV